MKHFYLVSFFTLITLFCHSQKFEVGPAPEWVVPVNPMIESKVSKYDVNNGVYNSLLDYQINLGLGADYTHGTMKIVSNAGVPNASEIYISYDTTYQYVVFHSLNIWRNGEKIDRLNELEFEFLSNEQNLGQGIYTGAVTAYEILEDIRKDDIIEYAYTIFGDNPIYGENHFRLLALEDLNPMDLVTARIIYPKKEKYYHRCKGCGNVALNEFEKGDYRGIEFRVEHVPSKEIEETIPTWIIPYAHFTISSTNSWKEVNDWALTVFKTNEKSNFSQVFDEVFDGTETREEKIDKLLDFVQNDIRYMGIESGIGSIQPFPPDKVISQRFGDCKDKTSLFIALLKALDIKTAYPALVNTALWQGVDSLLPSGQAFNHVIVCLDYEGERYWLDPTLTLQGGNFKKRYTPDYGLALVIKPETHSLSEMDVRTDISKTHIEEIITIEDFEKPAQFKVVSTMHGSNAEMVRSMFEHYSLREASDFLRNIYSSIFPSIQEAEKIQIKDDVEANIITLIETYSIPDLWRVEESETGNVRLFQYEPMPLYSYVNAISCEIKEYPVQLNYPSSYTQRTVITLPIDLTLNMLPQDFENAAFRFQRTARSLNSKSIEVSYDYQGLTHSISPSQYQEMCKQMNTITYDLPFRITYPVEELRPKLFKVK